MPPEPIVWQPDERTVSRSVTARFMRAHGLTSYPELVVRSHTEPEWFWASVVDFLGIPFQSPYQEVLDASRGKPWSRWFVGGRINLSEACVDRWAVDRGEAPAVVAVREGGESRTLSFAELLDQVARLAGALHALGVGKGDAVGVLLPMSEHAVIAFLAVARIGALFVPIFSGYGPQAIATRLRDAEASAVITADGFVRRGRVVPLREHLEEALGELAVGPRHIVVASYSPTPSTSLAPGDVRWDEAVSDASPMAAVTTESEDPVMLAYTSGTTGRPKGAVHVHGGLTVKLAQEGAFQLDLQPGDLHLWLTDMGWIMGPWMVVAGLANGAAIATYDGAADFPDPGRVWRLVESLGITALGISPTLIRALQGAGDEPLQGHDLSSLRAFGSTGEPWNPAPWWWLFENVGHRRVPIVNLSGGTEVGACFLSVNLLQGIKPCSLGGPALGMAVDVYGPDGRPVRGEVGELVCTQPWPGMTRGFWKDPQRYLEAYWSRFEDVWVHGDWASIDEEGFWYLHGRSDDTLNIAGKRVGPAEIESVVVGHSGVVMAAAIGVPDPVKGERLIVYAVPTSEASERLPEAIGDRIAAELGKPFRPGAVFLVPDLPRTRSAKIMRRLIRSRALGEELGDLSGLENPEAVEAIPVWKGH